MRRGCETSRRCLVKGKLDEEDLETLMGLLRQLLPVAAVLILGLAQAKADPPRVIKIDGKFDDWKGIKSYTDPANNTHDTDHKLRDDKPDPVDHPDVDLLEYKFTHDKENLYAYFRSRGQIGRTQVEGPGKIAGRFYAVLAIDVDNDPKTGYWISEGGYYPTSDGYDVNAEIEWFNGQFNAGWYLNHECVNDVELAQAFLDQSSGQYRKDYDGPYPAGFMRLGPGTYRHYTQWVYHKNDTLTFTRDKGPKLPGIIQGALSPDGHELEMSIPIKGFLKTKDGQPIIKPGATINISFSLEASGELSKDKRWASNSGQPIKGYVLEP
jgi:hypothetical protein